jgi:mono/diheme cytochrome c family protein
MLRLVRLCSGGDGGSAAAAGAHRHSHRVGRPHQKGSTEGRADPADPNLLAGAKLYREYCAVCHGMPGQPKTATANGMFPAPPQLMHGKGVTDDPVGETFWKAANGIRLTGMPAYRGSLTDEQLWQISWVLASSDKLPQSAKDVLATPPPAQ